MNSLCFVCQDPCTRVCTHPKCNSPPYFCSGPCNKGISQKMHTHDGVQKYITYGQLQQKLGDFQNLQNPQIFHQKYFNQIQKKAHIAKSHIEDQIKQIDILVKQNKQQMCKLLNFGLEQPTKKIIKKISQDKTGESLTGEQVNSLYKMYTDILNYQNFEQIKNLQLGFKDGFDALCQLKFSSMFLNFKKITQSNKFYGQGEKLIRDKQAEKALEKFLLASELNQFDYRTYFQMGRCYSLLNDIDKSHQSFERCLLLNPQESETYANIGRVHYKKGNYEQALKWCDKATERGNDTANFWAFKGACYCDWKKYPESISCYEKASSKNPENEDYKKNLIWLKQAMEREKKKNQKK